MNSEIILDSRIYPIEIIKRGISDYQQVAKIKIIRVTGDKVYCRIECLEEDFKIIKNEYCNYLIALRNIVER